MVLHAERWLQYPDNSFYIFFKGPKDSIYEYIDPTPVASASIAQVHAARLKGSQANVVIKVLKPGIEDVLVADLNFNYVVARIAEFFNLELSRALLVAIVNDIRASMLEEFLTFFAASKHGTLWDPYFCPVIKRMLKLLLIQEVPIGSTHVKHQVQEHLNQKMLTSGNDSIQNVHDIDVHWMSIEI